MGHTKLRYDLSETKHQVTLKLLEHLDGLIKLLASEKETWLRRVCATHWDGNFLTRHHKTSPFLWDFATGNHIFMDLLFQHQLKSPEFSVEANGSINGLTNINNVFVSKSTVALDLPPETNINTYNGYQPRC